MLLIKKEHINRFKKNQNGFMSIYTILLLSVLLPFLIFFAVEMIHFSNAKDIISTTTERMGKHAVRSVEVVDDVIHFNEEEAADIAYNLLIENLHLHGDYTPTEQSSLKEKPTYFFDIHYPDKEFSEYVPTEINLHGQSITLEYPAVSVYVKAKPKGVFVNQNVEFEKMVVYEVRISDTYEPTEGEEDNMLEHLEFHQVK